MKHSQLTFISMNYPTNEILFQTNELNKHKHRDYIRTFISILSFMAYKSDMYVTVSFKIVNVNINLVSCLKLLTLKRPINIL